MYQELFCMMWHRQSMPGWSKLQYSSIIAPELNGVTADVREMARESLEFNSNLIEGQEVTVEWGYKLRSDRGNYQAFVFLADGRMVNEIILDEGYAKLHIEPPNLKYADRLRKAGGFSRAQGQGLWRHEEGRKEHTIYIGDKMTKKFHFRGCEDLDGKSQAHLKEFPARIKALSDGYQFCSVCRDRYSEETDIF